MEIIITSHKTGNMYIRIYIVKRVNTFPFHSFSWKFRNWYEIEMRKVVYVCVCRINLWPRIWFLSRSANRQNFLCGHQMDLLFVFILVIWELALAKYGLGWWKNFIDPARSEAGHSNGRGLAPIPISPRSHSLRLCCSVSFCLIPCPSVCVRVDRQPLAILKFLTTNSH